jgi:ribose 5-phosphate isomerase B
MKVAIGSDHGGVCLKNEVIKTLGQMGVEYVDFGVFSDNESVDYPEYAQKVAAAVSEGKADRGILMCGTGIGMAIAANKVKGIRCANVYDEFTARLCVEHNNANIVTLGGRTLKEGQAESILKAYFNARFSGDGRHARRLAFIADMEGRENK